MYIREFWCCSQGGASSDDSGEGRDRGVVDVRSEHRSGFGGGGGDVGGDLKS